MLATIFRQRLSLAGLLGLGVVLVLPASAWAAEKNKERDIFDHKAHKAAEGVKKIFLVADTDPHGDRGNHEFVAAAIYLARTINANYPTAYAAVYTKQKWPKDLTGADAVIVLMNHGGSSVNPAVEKATKAGAGFMAVHYGVEVNKGNQGKSYLNWLGGYFEPYWSVNPWWTPEFKEIPQHETTRGVKPFSINDEWYYHMRFVDGMKGVTPVLSAVAPLKTINYRSEYPSDDAIKDAIKVLKARQAKAAKDDQARIGSAISALDKLVPHVSPHGGNPDVFKAVSAGEPQVMAWAYERPDGGRGFGFTGLHKHDNLGNINMRTLLLNAAAWVAKLPVPANGVQSRPLDRGDLEQLIDDGKLAVKRRGI
jgi:hypothetical protein